MGKRVPNIDINETRGLHHDSEHPHWNMTTYQLPPPFAARSQFMVDPSVALPEPNRYDMMSQMGHSRRMHEIHRPSHDDLTRRSYHEPLPPVSQLLTPGSQYSIIPASPFSPQLSSDSSEGGSTQFSSRRNESGPCSYHGSYDTVPVQLQQRDEVAPRANGFHPLSLTAPYRQPYPSTPPANIQHYPPHSESNRPVPSSGQHRQIAPLTSPIQFYQARTVKSDPLSPSAPAPELSRRETANAVKPLPRVVGEQIIPGEGPCWVYKDGSTCKKVIDGEAVNAQWGITKAGKPRKRLAIACTTCREKKIKCDPRDSKCVQCDKFGRECRFTTAHRGQHASPETSSYKNQACDPSMSPEIDTPVQQSSGPHAEGPDIGPTSSESQQEPSSGTRKSQEHSISESASHRGRPTPKRRRQRSPDVSGMKLPYKVGAASDPKNPISLGLSAMTPWDGIQSNVGAHSFDWGNNPYEVDPEITMHYIQTYFLHINAATYRLFPRDLFISWLTADSMKTLDDLMLIYTMLAMGSVFSSRAERKHEGSLFAKIARYAAEKNLGNYSLQLIQSRLLLAFYHFSLGDAHRAWDYGGMGLRVVSGLKFNLEDGITDIHDDDILSYGLNRHALEECRRRTFWAAYMMDRFSGCCSGHLCVIHDEDTSVRLPCTEEVYNNQEAVQTPYFDNELTDQRLCQVVKPSKLGPMAYYAQISSIWGDVLSNIYRSPHQSMERYSADHEAFHITIHQRLASWKSSLPVYLSYNASNTRAIINNGYMGTFISLHTIYHATIMKLNRHIRHAQLSSATVKRSIQEANHHAIQLLKMMRTLSEAGRQEVPNSVPTQIDQQQFKIPFSTAFAGYAVLTATDILTAGGSIDPAYFKATLGLMNGGLKVVEGLSQFWASARAQCKAICRRVEQLAKDASAEDAAGKKMWIARRPMDKTFDGDQDAFYNESMQHPAERVKFLQNLGLQAEESEILVVGGESRGGGWWE